MTSRTPPVPCAVASTSLITAGDSNLWHHSRVRRWQSDAGYIVRRCSLEHAYQFIVRGHRHDTRAAIGRFNGAGLVVVMPFMRHGDAHRE